MRWLFMINGQVHHTTSRREGFTFVEVLVALVMTTLLVTATCSSLMGAFRAEETARSLHESQFVLQDIACASYMGLQPSNAMSR
ncbi:MAG: prepilin-type N-terminal cleavage/methylation domain-containing protein, partial [Lentisphaerota bacterium]